MIENVIEFICLKFYLKVLNNRKEYIVKKIENNNFDLYITKIPSFIFLYYYILIFYISLKNVIIINKYKNK